jgi:hypothetical protein
MPWHQLTLDSSATLFTTAQLRWRPVAEDDPNGAQIATLWGEPGGAFAAVVRSPDDVYTFIRRETSES